MITTIDEYIAQYKDNKAVSTRLNAIRDIIKKTAPEATEKISWQMPTFVQGGILVQFAAFKEHISLFPGPDCIEAIKQELSEYKISKGTIQFQNSKPLPEDLIQRIARYKINENRNKGKK